MSEEIDHLIMVQCERCIWIWDQMLGL